MTIFGQIHANRHDATLFLSHHIVTLRNETVFNLTKYAHNEVCRVQIHAFVNHFCCASIS